jgi:fatty acid desaturase
MLNAVGRLTDRFAYPLRLSHYVELVNPLCATHAMWGRVEAVWDETRDARTLTLKPGLNWRGYVRQLLGSCNIGGGRLFHVLSGNLSHQIAHHLFPDLPSNRYSALAVRVRALSARYGIPYNAGSLTRQFVTTVLKILRLSLPGGLRPT